ncbi:U3 small nucleolar RNA-associated protein [Taphrina deformans PYCC 5710]|uniref:U3 small nucleolar RNA-associated protein n=1 Tax=Taphrina deformans (strain PYCC 5710 / ATCC 11124 / CBS 356.35 / IMI 108563 / JCM 9778 / NBRC 8474) TaxID=1097556 RepID=R4XG46_TAPDE|nr:U3 small nucleolar RNA-associated protein [Taphrina deformans PYCC 5710]|eukprot:CCG83469.1 U3 small nucleolar RNA-associated protein [Taphrina deformans PYCC 5710]
MSGHRRPAKKRSSGTVSLSTERKTKSGKKGQSKKKATQRSLNAFRLGDQGVESGSEGDGVVKPEDDEEIDSDEAFESGDEDKFDSYKFSGSTNRTAKRKRGDATHFTKEYHKDAIEVDLAEESAAEQSDSYDVEAEQKRPCLRPVKRTHSSSDEDSASDFEDDAGDDLMDLSEMLGPSRSVETSKSAKDMAPSRSTPLHPVPQHKSASIDNDEDAADAADDTDDAESLQSWSGPQSTQSDEEEEDTDSRSSEDDSSGDQAAPVDALENFVTQLEKKRRSGVHQSPANPQRQKSHGVRVLESNERAQESEYNLALPSQGNKLDLESMMGSLGGQRGKILNKTQALQAPLAKPIQDRIDRAAAYDTVKEQITKWQPAVRQLREAAVLKFPLVEQNKIQANNNSLASTFKPANELENNISNILKESGMQSENSISKFEDLEMAKLSIEEVQKRRADLAIMRDLLFRQEQKAKRQSKIKSKAFRRVHRKEKEKLRLAMEEANPDAAGAAMKDAESIRARERMELRHKNTGKWASKMLQRADHGEGSRAAITEQLQRGEELERKIRGHKGNTESSDSDSDNVPLDEAVDEPLPKRGVFSMKFMRDADAQQSATLSDDDHDALDADPAQLPKEQGRRVFKPVASQTSRKQTQTTRSESALSRKTHSSGSLIPSVTETDSGRISQGSEDNPWLSGTTVARKDKGTLITRDTEDSLKFVAKLKRRKDEKRQLIQHEGRISNPRLDIGHKLPLKDSFMDINDDSTDEQNLQDLRQVALRQAELVGRAFAGDDVVAEFEAAKDSAIKEDAPQEIDETLPGWGSWTGDGVKKSRTSRKFIKHVPGVRNEQRRDLKLQHVIINEKRLKQAKPYMSQSVPYPFENKEQYERSLNLPIGPEFTTRTNFQKQIMPHIITKQGKVVAPMERPFKT